LKDESWIKASGLTLACAHKIASLVRKNNFDITLKIDHRIVTLPSELTVPAVA